MKFKLFIFLKFFCVCFLCFTSIGKAESNVFDPQTVMSKELQAGNGILIFNIQYYKSKQKLRDEDFKGLNNLDEVILKLGEPRDMTAAFSVNALRIDKPNKEEAFKKFNALSAVALMSPPGERTISSVSLFGGGGTELTFSIFNKINVEAGKIKYVGDIVVFDPVKFSLGRPQTLKPVINYKYQPDSFRNTFQKNCPSLISNLVSVKLPLKH